MIPHWRNLTSPILEARFNIHDDDLARGAGQYLKVVLSQGDHPDCPRTLSLLRFLTRYPTLKSPDTLVSSVIEALMRALGWAAKSRNTSTFALVVDSLCNLINNGAYNSYRLSWFVVHDCTVNLRAQVIRQLCDSSCKNGNAEPSHGDTSSGSKLSSVLEVKGNYSMH